MIVVERADALQNVGRNVSHWSFRWFALVIKIVCMGWDMDGLRWLGYGWFALVGIKNNKSVVRYKETKNVRTTADASEIAFLARIFGTHKHQNKSPVRKCIFL